MKRHATFPALAGLALLLASGGAYADESQRQVWHDSEDQIVHNSWGTCVRSRWDIGADPCAVVVAYQPPPPAVRTIIAEADRTVYFPFNKSELTPESQQRLDQLAQRINAASDIQDAQVVGYADRIGTTSYNQALSKKRAETVRDYLIGRNVITEQDTMTRWVGKSDSNTQCAPNLTHDQLIQCLAPDRKVTVDLKYKKQIETQPQTNAVPPGPMMGQPPLAPTAAAHAIPLEAPRNVSTHYPPYPMEKNGVVPAYPLEQSSEADQAVIVHPLEAPSAVQAPSAAPANAPGSSVQTYPMSAPSTVQTYPLRQSSADMQSATPQPQPDSASPTAYEMQAAPDAGQYAQTAYQAEYPASDHPADQSQPSDQYRERYLTTGE